MVLREKKGLMNLIFQFDNAFILTISVNPLKLTLKDLLFGLLT